MLFLTSSVFIISHHFQYKSCRRLLMKCMKLLHEINCGVKLLNCSYNCFDFLVIACFFFWIYMYFGYFMILFFTIGFSENNFETISIFGLVIFFEGWRVREISFYYLFMSDNNWYCVRFVTLYICPTGTWFILEINK